MKLSIRSKLLLMMVLMSIVASVILIVMGYRHGESAMTGSYMKQLESVKQAKKNEVEAYIENLKTITEVFGSNTMVKEAITSFKAGFNALEKDELNLECHSKLSSFYDDFLVSMRERMEVKMDNSIYYPNSTAACYLQYEYIVDNEYPSGQKSSLMDANDNSQYSSAHRKYNAYFRDMVDKFGLYDLFLIDIEQGDILYSVEKEIDFATNLYSGAYRESNLAELARTLRVNRDLDKAMMVDYQRYRPSYGQPAAFIGIPIIEGGMTLGALVIQIPIKKIDDILTGYKSWEMNGLGKTGEVYIVGDDYLMRSVSRFFLEDSLNYLKNQGERGLSEGDIKSIQEMGSTVLYQDVKNDAVLKAINHESGFYTGPNYRSPHVLSTYAPLNIDGLNWAILADLDYNEVLEEVAAFKKKLFTALFLMALIITFLSMFLAGKFVKYIEVLTEGVRRVKEGNYKDLIAVHSKDEFGELADAFNSMTVSLAEKEERIEKQQEQHLDLLYNFVPKNIADRLMKGETEIAEYFNSVTLVLIDVVGFSELTMEKGPKESIVLLNELVSAFDKNCLKHQIDKIRTIGDSYLASSGMLTTRLDHARRTIEFAKETRQLIYQFNINYKTDLQLHISVHTGPLMAGIVGKESFNYDVWGGTVNDLFRINQIPQNNEIIISENTNNLIKEFYHTESIDHEDLSGFENVTAIYKILSANG